MVAFARSASLAAYCRGARGSGQSAFRTLNEVASKTKQQKEICLAFDPLFAGLHFWTILVCFICIVQHRMEEEG